MYQALMRFRDLTDGHLYEQGDAFPYDGRVIPEDRLNSLKTGENQVGKPVIGIYQGTDEKPVKRAKKR